jgi:hypothetical protein
MSELSNDITTTDSMQAQDVSCRGDARGDGYIVIENAIPQAIISATNVNRSDAIDSPQGQHREFRGAPSEKIREHFHAVNLFQFQQQVMVLMLLKVLKLHNDLREALVQLGVSPRDLDEIPKIVFGQYLEHSPQNLLSAEKRASFVYVTIALSPQLSPSEGLQEFLPGSHKLPATKLYHIDPVRITLKMGWAVAWTSQIVFKWPPGGGGFYATLLYHRTA